jgi:hypothetical protein
MDKKELMTQHPALYKEVFGEGESKGKAEGLAEGKKAGVEEGKLTGAAAERERIKGIESITAPGSAKIIAENKFSPEATKETVAVLVCEANSATLTAVAKNTTEDAAAVAATAATTQPPAVDSEKAKSEEKAADDIAKAANKI